ncbi:hypothetical protein [Paraburkholderia sediminicola]|uniref:hypothetical protein n=1 Tax=Paraburkholderia sediminicola TaxID=458836 RepID=UPI0038BB5E1F
MVRSEPRHFVPGSDPTITDEMWAADARPDDDHTTRLVFIVQGLARSVIEETITHFLREAGVEATASC